MEGKWTEKEEHVMHQDKQNVLVGLNLSDINHVKCLQNSYLLKKNHKIVVMSSRVNSNWITCTVGVPIELHQLIFGYLPKLGVIEGPSSTITPSPPP